MSHHFDSPTAIEDGRLNLLDVYVFPESPGTSTLLLGVNPDAGRSSPTTFRPDALYEFVIASDGGTREDRAFRMSFAEPDADGNQEMQVRYAVGPPSRSGLEGTELGVGHMGEAFALGNGGSAWFGLAQDPFWGDAVALFAFTHGLAANQYRPELFTGTPGNLLAGRNVTAIALQVPDVTFGGIDVALWARISLYGHAPQRQVSRAAHPLLRSFFFPQPDGLHDDAFGTTLSLMVGRQLGVTTSPYPVVPGFPHLAPAGHDDIPALADMLGCASIPRNRRPADAGCAAI